MKRLILFCGVAGLMLGTATPPRRMAAAVADMGVAPEVGGDAAEGPRMGPVPAIEPQKVLPDALVNRMPEPPAPAKAAVAVVANADRPPAPPAAPLPPPAPLRIVVSLSQQKAFVYKAGALVAVSPVSTGRRGHETPTGTFPIMEKDVHHRSNIYSNAPMPYMQRLTAYGIALHAGHLPGYPASHGCIRLPYGFARKLYAMTDARTVVTVTRARVKGRPS